MNALKEKRFKRLHTCNNCLAQGETVAHTVALTAFSTRTIRLCRICKAEANRLKMVTANGQLPTAN